MPRHPITMVNHNKQPAIAHAALFKELAWLLLCIFIGVSVIGMLPTKLLRVVGGAWLVVEALFWIHHRTRYRDLVVHTHTYTHTQRTTIHPTPIHHPHPLTAYSTAPTMPHLQNTTTSPCRSSNAVFCNWVSTASLLYRILHEHGFSMHPLHVCVEAT